MKTSMLVEPAGLFHKNSNKRQQSRQLLFDETSINVRWPDLEVKIGRAATP